MTIRFIVHAFLTIAFAVSPLAAEHSVEEHPEFLQAGPMPVDEAGDRERIKAAPEELHFFLERDLQLRLECEVIRERHDYLGTEEFYVELRSWREERRSEISETADAIAVLLDEAPAAVAPATEADPPLNAPPELTEFLKANRALQKAWRKRLESFPAAEPDQVVGERRKWRKENAAAFTVLEDLALRVIQAEDVNP